MKNLYIVYHVNKNNDHTKIIGMYASLQKAKDTIATYKTIKGFKDTPSGFFIDKCPLDTLYWQKGYTQKTITETS